MMHRGPRVNLSLPELPGDLAFLRAVQELQDDRTWGYGASASDIAYKLGVKGARRLGRGAVKGSWSGRMSASLRVSPRLVSLTKRGLLSRFTGQHYDGTSEYRYRYVLTKAGQEALDSIRGIC